MKGVSMIRARLRPVAECQHPGCGWTFNRPYITAAIRASRDGQRCRGRLVRNHAEDHVMNTGHIVTVTIRDIAEYSRTDR